MQIVQPIHSSTAIFAIGKSFISLDSITFIFLFKILDICFSVCDDPGSHLFNFSLSKIIALAYDSQSS